MAISIALIILLGLTADYIARRFKIPGLVGMLFAGVVCGPYALNLLAPEMMSVSGDFRKIALIVILLRAGFELRRDTLNKVGKTALVMSCVPAIFEIAAIVFLAPKFLPISYFDAAVLGTILSAVSPAVVVPLMIDFMDRNRGAKKGIPTLILAASSIDDVFVIVLFTILVGMNGGPAEHLWLKFAQIPVSILLGIAIGLIPGYFLYRLFTKYDFKPPKRTILVLGTAVFISWIETASEHWIPIASLLGVMAIGFIILEKSEPVAHLISQKLKKLWVFAELLLFVLVGAQVNIHVALDAGLAGALVILAGLLARSVGTYISLFGAGLDMKEKLFCVVAYIPKATVQAAIGAIPLSMGMASGEIILAVAVLSIIITAPIGAVGIKLIGERVLDTGGKSPYRFRELREKLMLPRVGERIRSKKFDTVWKVIEEKEVWMEPPEGSNTPGNQPVPAVKIRLWKEGGSPGPGKGKTQTFCYSHLDPSFNDHWEIIYDW
jgi:solute carrier family 9B (sodium/hydrogen exchanger), member 1/2